MIPITNLQNPVRSLEWGRDEIDPDIHIYIYT